MALSTNAVFCPNAASVSAQWKSVAPTTSGSGGVSTPFKAVGATGDSVSVSKLGQALKGIAADAFQYLDDKTRGALESAVESGRIKAEVVVNGLTHLAKEALESRYVREKTPTEEDIESAKRINEYRSAEEEYMTKKMDVRKIQFDKMDVAQAAFDSGSMSWDGMVNEWDAAEKEASEKIETLSNIRKERPDGLLAISSAYKELDGLNLGGNGVTAGEANEASLKLSELQLEPGSLSEAMKKFANDYDIPGIGRGKDASAQSGNLDAKEEAEAKTAQQTASVVATAPASTIPAPAPATPTSTPIADKGNAQAAIDLLQSALGAKAQTGTAAYQKAVTDQSSTTAAALLAALKGGVSFQG